MKQITLESNLGRSGLQAPCLGRLLFVWGAYGCGMAVLWRLASGNPWEQAATWAIALTAAVGLILVLREI